MLGLSQIEARNLRYAFAAVLFVSGILIISFANSRGAPAPFLLGMSGVAASAGVIVRNDKVLRCLCALVLIASTALILLGRVSPNSMFWFPIAALSIVVAIGIVLRLHWPWMVTLVMSIVVVGSWAVTILSTVLKRGWPYSTIEATLTWLVPGTLFSAVWVWCAIAAMHLSRRA